MKVLELFLLALVRQTGVVLLKRLSFCCQGELTEAKEEFQCDTQLPLPERLAAALTLACNYIYIKQTSNTWENSGAATTDIYFDSHRLHYHVRIKC